VQIDALAIRLRGRTAAEASDLGVRLCQVSARSVFRAHAAVALPVFTLALSTVELAGWLPAVLIWWSKPWIDRSILFVLSRAAFGQTTAPVELWRNQRQLWWRHFLFTWTVRRCSPWRSLTDPVYGLEGLSLRDAGRRVRQLRRRHIGSGLMLTHTFVAIELSITLAVLSLIFWLAPQGAVPDLASMLDGSAHAVTLIISVTYALTVFVVEPFYVAAGFAIYLNRRAELEAWDIEQEFRRAFSH
jgi:hypothetical protein